MREPSTSSSWNVIRPTSSGLSLPTTKVLSSLIYCLFSFVPKGIASLKYDSSVLNSESSFWFILVPLKETFLVTYFTSTVGKDASGIYFTSTVGKDASGTYCTSTVRKDASGNCFTSTVGSCRYLLTFNFFTSFFFLSSSSFFFQSVQQLSSIKNNKHDNTIIIILYYYHVWPLILAEKLWQIFISASV